MDVFIPSLCTECCGGHKADKTQAQFREEGSKLGMDE